MKLWQSILLGVVILSVLVYVVSAVVGTLFSVAVAGLVIVAIGVLLNYWLRGREAPLPGGKRQIRKEERQAERALRELENKVKRQH